MGGVVDAIGDVLESAWDAVGNIVENVWAEVCMPILEEVFSWFGIEDTTVVSVQKKSIAIFGDNTEDVIQQSITRAVLTSVKSSTSFFSNYMQEIYTAKGQIKGYYFFAEKDRYIHGLPTMEVKGGQIDTTAINSALNTDQGGTFTVTSTNSGFIDPGTYFKHFLQSSPYFYLPGSNTLTYTDPHSIVRTDYRVDSIIQDLSTTDYIITISRTAELATFWIKGLASVVEGDTITYTIYSNRTVPTGNSVDINFIYGGTAVDGIDYTSIASVTMLEGTNSVTVDIVTVENLIADSSRTFSITIDSIIDTYNSFEETAIHSLNSITTVIVDDDSLILTMADILVDESSGNVVIPVTLEAGASAAFTVDYGMSNITAVGGLDYDNTPGTLNFNGTAGEIQNITIPITSDILDDDIEQFLVYFTSCSDVTIDISVTATVTIIDSTTPGPTAGTTQIVDTIIRPNFTTEARLAVTYYDTAGSATDWFYWVYTYSAGTYTGLNSEISYITNLEMLPVGILRKDKISITTNKNTEEYKTTQRLLRNLALDLDSLVANIESNPDINLLTDAYINFAICPNDTHQLVSKLLYSSFYELIVTNGLTSNTNEYSISFSEQDVNNAVVWSDQSYTTDIVGVIAAVGEYTHLRTETSTTVFLHLRYQATATTYNEIVLSNLNGMAAIDYGTHHNIAFNAVGDSNFTIPVSWYIINQLTPKEQLEVYQYIFRLDFYALQVTELAWYQTPSFASLFKFVLTTITIISLFSASGFTAALWKLFSTYLIMELVIYIAEVTGDEELAAVVGLVAAIALSDAGYLDFGEMLSGEQLLNLSTNFANNLTTVYNIENEDLANDIRDINNMADQRLQEIKDANPTRTIDTSFIAALQSVDVIKFPAIQGQYEFDQVYNYDTLVGNFVNNRLLTGII